MKKIVAAWIEQILEFPTKLEYLAYIESLKKGKPQKFKETSFEQLESGVVRITIRNSITTMRSLMMKRKVKSKMTNTELLREKINASGYKLQFVAEKCGLTYFGLMKKVNNETEFKASEIKALKDLLNLTDDDATKIFFA